MFCTCGSPFWWKKMKSDAMCGFQIESCILILIILSRWQKHKSVPIFLLTRPELDITCVGLCLWRAWCWEKSPCYLLGFQVMCVEGRDGGPKYTCFSLRQLCRWVQAFRSGGSSCYNSIRTGERGIDHCLFYNDTTFILNVIVTLILETSNFTVDLLLY